jgi:hypothetical protein
MGFKPMTLRKATSIPNHLASGVPLVDLGKEEETFLYFGIELGAHVLIEDPWSV